MGIQAQETQVNEAMVLELLSHERSISLEAVVDLLPQMSWNQVFQCVDSLSRRGEIILLRHGFDYELVAMSKPHDAPCSV
ncbi:MAG TPA: hypothetical protein VFG71_09475 [Nitrospiraceae bacterium]|nr:hypothetical protein [Nitrospiraceae bacterium]